jgi:hypothetical protein
MPLLTERPPTQEPDAGVIEDARARQRRYRARGTAAVLAVALIAGLLLLVTGGTAGGGRSHSQPQPARYPRVLASYSDGFVVHYDAIIAYSQNGRPETGQIRDTWGSGLRERVMVYQQHPGQPAGPLRLESAFGPHNVTYWTGSPSTVTREIFHVPADRTESSCQPVLVLCVDTAPDPRASIQALDAAGELRDTGTTTLGGQRLEVLTADPEPRQVKWQALVNPRTDLPAEIREQVAGGLKLTTRITNYTRLPRTAVTQRLLSMSPHPGAKQCTATIYPPQQHRLSRQIRTCRPRPASR